MATVTPTLANRSTVAVLKRQRFKAARRVPLPHWTLVKGDLVEVRRGADAGKQGRISEIIRPLNRVLVSSLNVRPRQISATAQATGFIKHIPSPIHVSCLHLVDPLHKKATRSRHAYDAQGKRVRVSRSSGAIIPRPSEHSQQATGSRVVNSATDTQPSDASAISVQPLDFHALSAFLTRRRLSVQQERQQVKQQQSSSRAQQRMSLALTEQIHPASSPITALSLSPSPAVVPSSFTDWPVPVSSRRHFPTRVPSLPPFPYSRASQLVGQHALLKQRQTVPAGIEYIHKP